MSAQLPYSGTMRVDSKHASQELPLWLTLLAPPLMFLVQIVVRLLDTGQGFYLPLIETEYGLVESATALVLVPAAILSVRLVRIHSAAGERLLASWFMLTAFACVMFLGEEVSWGQHWFGWESPEYFQQHNIQQETNLHNLSKDVERSLKFIVGAAVVFGGLLGPRLRERLAGLDDGLWPALRAVLPTRACVPTVVMALLVWGLERTRTWTGFDAGPPWNINLKETFEFYLALYISMYIAAAWYRTRATLPSR